MKKLLLLLITNILFANIPTQLALSQLTGTLVGYALNKDKGATTGYNISTSAEKYNRQLHEKEIEFIKDKAKEYAKQHNISEKEAKSLFYLVSKSLVDKYGAKKLTEKVRIREYLDKYPEINAHSKELKQHISNITDILLKYSKTHYYADINSKKTQNMFTSTYSEYQNPSYNPNYDPTYIDTTTSAGLAIGGTVSTGGLSWFLWGVGLLRDAKSAVESGNYVKNLSPDAVSIPRKENIYGPKIGAGLTGFNIYEQLKNNAKINQSLEQEVKMREANENK